MLSFSSERHALFEPNDQVNMFGRQIDSTRDFVGVMNGDGSVSELAPRVHITNGRVIVVLNGAFYGNLRINYVVVLRN